MTDAIKKQTSELMEIVGDASVWMKKLDALNEDLQEQILGLGCINEIKDETVKECLYRIYAYTKTRFEIISIQNMMSSINDIARLEESCEQQQQQQADSVELSIQTLEKRLGELNNLACALSSMLSGKVMKDEPRRVKFSNLALGARFHYLKGNEILSQTFVKIWPDRVAAWVDTQIDTRWTGQGIFSANDDNTDLDFEVEIVR